MTKVYLAAPIQTDSIVDGDGLRAVVWFQGCPHQCPGCHNPKSHSFNTGIETTTEEVIKTLTEISNQDGVTFSGGDPLAQPEALLEIIKDVRLHKLNIWVYTGWTFEILLEKSKTDQILAEILKNIDVLVDGPFIQKEKTLNLKFRGSRNQRIIDIRKSLKQNKIVLIPKYKKEKKVKKF